MPSTTEIIVNTGGGGDYLSAQACAEDLVGHDLVAGDWSLHPTTGPGADGTDLSTDPDFPVTTDITGAARNGVYYLGAFGTGPAARDSSIGEAGRPRRRRKYWFFYRRRR